MIVITVVAAEAGLVVLLFVDQLLVVPVVVLLEVLLQVAARSFLA